jgi:hypothetical protein
MKIRSTGFVRYETHIGESQNGKWNSSYRQTTKKQPYINLNLGQVFFEEPQSAITEGQIYVMAISGRRIKCSGSNFLA